MNRTSRQTLSYLIAGLLAATALAAALSVGGPTAPAWAAGATASATTPTAGTTGTGTAAETTTTAQTTLSSGAGVTYGIGDTIGTFAQCAPGVPACCTAETASCDLAHTDGWFKDTLFQRLTAPASAHRVTQVRLFVPYDALQEFNGSTAAPGCVYSRAVMRPWTDLAGRLHDPGQAWRALLAGLIEARAEGLTPVVAITGYGSPHAMPSWDQPAPDPTTTAGWWSYHCGVQGILDAVAKLPGLDQPHIWEAFNEPDGFRTLRSIDGTQAHDCTPSATAQPNGAAKAACLYVEGEREIHQFSGHEQDTVVAGAFMHTSIPYLTQYAAALARELPGAAFPADWSVHDYFDVTNAYDGPKSTQLAPFDDALGTVTGGRAHELWVTEAGTLLTSARRTGECPAIGPDPAGTLGACVDGQAARQQADAQAFVSLPAEAHTVPITHLFWYQWRSAVHWDSGLVDSAGRPRAGWCALYGSGTCDGDTTAPSG